MIASSKNMIIAAQKGGYAIPAVNVENMEMAQGVIEAAEECESPVIIQTTPGTVRYGNVKLYRQMIGAVAEDKKIPVAVHLDHGSSFDTVMQAAFAGYTSVMIDGSHLDFDENVILSKSVADVCRAVNIPVEAELGKVGGREDDTESDEYGYTDPEQAREFVERTGIFSLAIGIGTSHGIYSGTPKLDKERVGLIARKIETPLVLHGTSGVQAEDVRECIRRGICKVNYATELRLAFTKGVKEAMSQNPDAFDPKFYLAEGRARVKAAAKVIIEICGSSGRLF